MQIALSQEFPSERVIIILAASCLHVTYNVVPYMFVLKIFQHISGVVLFFYKKSQLPIKKGFFVATLELFHKTGTGTVLHWGREGGKGLIKNQIAEWKYWEPRMSEV